MGKNKARMHTGQPKVRAVGEREQNQKERFSVLLESQSAGWGIGIRSLEDKGSGRGWRGGGECLHQGTGLPQGELGEAGPAGGRGRGASQARSPRGNQGEKWPEAGCCRWGGSCFQGL